MDEDNELMRLVCEYGVNIESAMAKHPRYPVDSDPNPFVLVDRNKCIQCLRCVRACAEIQGRFVWSQSYRGYQARIVAGDDSTMLASRCESCGACVAYCPTGALDSPPTIDASRCISYLTIELRGPIPISLRPLMGNWVFGCDDRQTVCPWNPTTDVVPSAFLQPSLIELLTHGEESFEATFGATPLARAKRRGIARNAAVALGNSGNPRAIGDLERALREDPEPIVRGHAAWALGRIGGPEARKALAAAKASQELPPAPTLIFPAQ